MSSLLSTKSGRTLSWILQLVAKKDAFAAIRLRHARKEGRKEGSVHVMIDGTRAVPRKFRESGIEHQKLSGHFTSRKDSVSLWTDGAKVTIT